MQACEHRGVDLVGLDLGPGDRSHLQRIGNDDTMHERLQQPNNDRCVSSSLKDNVVPLGQRLFSEGENGFAFHCESAVVLHKAVLEDGDLCEVSMNIQSDDSHGRTSCSDEYTAEARGQHDNYGFALAAQPGRSKGQPDNNPSSQLIV